MFHARALVHVYEDSIRWSDHIGLLYIALRIRISRYAFSGLIACGICPLLLFSLPIKHYSVRNMLLCYLT